MIRSCKHALGLLTFTLLYAHVSAQNTEVDPSTVNDGGSNLIWILLIVGVLLLIGLLYWLIKRPMLLQDGGTSPTPTPPTPAVKKIICVDAGHGGTDSGAVNSTLTPNVNEKDINLATALKLQTILSKKYTVIMTRTTDVFVGLDARAKIANDAKADLFISIHSNSNNAATATGTETFVYKLTLKNSKKLADLVHPEVVKALGLTDRGVKEGNLRVLRKTTMPAILVELGFVSNPSDVKVITDTTKQDAAAQGIADGVDAYFK